jgi:regulator of protease activity HflC (stomatin/prohibitin superfamily)
MSAAVLSHKLNLVLKRINHNKSPGKHHRRDFYSRQGTVVQQRFDTKIQVTDQTPAGLAVSHEHGKRRVYAVWEGKITDRKAVVVAVYLYIPPAAAASKPAFLTRTPSKGFPSTTKLREHH